MVSGEQRRGEVLKKRALQMSDGYMDIKHKKDIAVVNQCDEQNNKKQRKALKIQENYENYKMEVLYPELLQIEDISSPEVYLLNVLKGIPNSVTVPKHWMLKRSYLHSKKTIYKKPYSIPDQVMKTGVYEIRKTHRERVASASLKVKMKQKLNPKVGNREVNYRKMELGSHSHTLSDFGELYYENKYQNDIFREMKPGLLSSELKAALNIKTDNTPPPWLYNMQKNGLPPAYPDLKVSGINAPIPEGCKFGLEEGNWGLPPTDSRSQPIYPDVYSRNMDVESIEGDVFFKPRNHLVIEEKRNQQPVKRVFDRKSGKFISI